MNPYGIALIAALCVLTTATIYACCVLSSESSERIDIPSNDVSFRGAKVTRNGFFC